MSARKVKRDEWSCPCCGTPNDGSYCAPCVDSGCGERDVNDPDIETCLAERAAHMGSRLVTAAARLIDVPGARISIVVSTEVEAHVLAKLLSGETWGHGCIYARWGDGNARRWLFGFRASVSGVVVEGHGNRAAAEAELANAEVWDPQETTAERRAAALAATEERPAMSLKELVKP